MKKVKGKISNVVSKTNGQIGASIKASQDLCKKAAAAAQNTLKNAGDIAKTAQDVVHLSAVTTAVVLERAAIPILKFTADATAPAAGAGASAATPNVASTKPST